MRRFFPPRLAWLALPAALTACRDSSVVSYRVPKDNNPPPATAATPAPSAPSGMPGAANLSTAQGRDLVWSAPAAWRTKTGSAMRKGSYAIGAEGSPTADLAITAFPGDVGGDLANVNRWRGQLGLGPISAAELPSALIRLEGTSLPIALVDLVNGDQRMLAAIVPFEGATWFFKLTGPDTLVGATKTEFIGFLRTVHAPASADPHAGLPPAAASPAPNSADMANTEVIKAEGPGLRWTAPAQWQPKPVSAMRKGSYAVTDATGATADLSITAFPGDVGGELANLNRWRGQLSLPPLAPADVAGNVIRREHGGLQLTIVDFSTGSQRLLGAIVPFNGATWFVKLTGPDALVGAEKPAFLAFLDTLQTP